MKILIKCYGFKCKRCGYKWISKLNLSMPKCCPGCKSPYWNRPRMKILKQRVLSKII